ncbi:MAG: anti-sigma factor [Acidobacteriota bacterium]
MRHEDYKEMLAANALSALDADESRALATHLEDCRDCLSELNEWQETVAFVALSTNPAEPSIQLRERILAAVRAAGSPSATYADSAAHRASSSSLVLPFEKRGKNVWTSLGSFGAIAAAFAMVAMLIGLLTLWQQNRSTRAELVRLATQMRETSEELAYERAMVALLTKPGSRMTELAGTNVAPGAHAMLAYDKTGHAMLMTRNLPAAPPGMAYQLWFIKDNQKMPGKVFTTDARGNGVLEDQIPASALATAVYAITLEPAGGVQVPTGAIYLVSAS